MEKFIANISVGRHFKARIEHNNLDYKHDSLN